MKLRVMTTLALIVCMAATAYGTERPSEDELITRAADKAGEQIANSLNVQDLQGLEHFVLMKLAGPMSDEITSIIQNHLNKVSKLSISAYRPEDLDPAGNFRTWLEGHFDKKKYSGDLDALKAEIEKEWRRTANIEGVFYGKIHNAQAKDGKAVVRISLKLLDIRPGEPLKTMKIVWEGYFWGEYRVDVPRELTEKQKRWSWRAFNYACKRAIHDMQRDKEGQLAELKRVLVVDMADDVLGTGTEALKVQLGRNSALTVVSHEGMKEILDEIRFVAEFESLGSIQIRPDTLKKLVDMKIADSILISKRISYELEESDGVRVTAALRLIKLDGEQVAAGEGEGRYPGNADLYFIIVAAVLAGSIVMFFVTSGLKNIQKKHLEKRKEKKKEGKRKETEIEEEKRRVETIADALRQDEALRNRMVGELAGARQILKKAQNDSQAAGKSDEAQFVKKSVNGLDNLIRRIETASYGDAELFKAGKISDKELNSLLGFERKMEAVIKDANVEAEGAGAAVASGDYVTLLDRLRDLDKKVVELGNKFTDRDRYIREAR